MHEHVKECFGNDWLKQQKKDLTCDLMGFGKADVHTAYKIVSNTLTKIDSIIGRLKGLQGFELWLKEASTAKKTLPDFLFELYCFDNLKFTPDSIVLKPYNSTGCGLEALLKTKEKHLYIEMHSINDIKATPQNKVNKFFSKARRKFSDKDGILFIDISRVNKVPMLPSPYIALDPKIAEIKDEIIKRFNNSKHANERIDAIILVNISLVSNPTKLWDTFFDKRFLLLPKPKHKGGHGHDIEFWNSVFNVNEFHLSDE